MLSINSKTEKLSYAQDPGDYGFWIWASGERGPRSASPGPYARKVAWVNNEEKAKAEIDLMIEFGEGRYTK